jgi:chorismate mutase
VTLLLLKCIKLGSATKQTPVKQSFIHVCVDVLYRTHTSVRQWPIGLLELYLEDAVSMRAWVDAKEATKFVQNLTMWASEPGSNAHQRHRKRTQSFEDESSGDEEVMEIGNNSSMIEPEVVPETCDRYAERHGEAADLVVSFLSSKAGIAAPASNTTASAGASSSAPAKLGNVVKAVTTFCQLPRIRETFGSPFIAKLLGNPALVDDVRKLAMKISDCFQLDSKTGLFISSDMAVIDGIVSLRYSLKSASHVEWHRHMLTAAGCKSFLMASRILKLLLSDDLENAINRQETIRLVSHLLQSLQSAAWSTNLHICGKEFQSAFAAAAVNSESEDGCTLDFTSVSKGCFALGYAVGQLAWDVAFRSKYSHWSTTLLKNLMDTLFKILKQFQASPSSSSTAGSLYFKAVDMVILVKNVLLGFACRTARDKDRLDLAPNQCIEDVLYYINDFCMFCQLMIASDYCSSEKDLQSSASVVGAAAGRGAVHHGGTASSSASSRSRTAALDALPPMFRGAQSRLNASSGLGSLSGAGFGNSSSARGQAVVRRPPVHEAPDSSQQQVVSARQDATAVDPAKALQVSKAIALVAIRTIQALSIAWVKVLVTSMSDNISVSRPWPLLLKKAGSEASVPGLAPSGISSCAEFWFDWLQQSLCFQFAALSKVSGDFDKGSSFLLKESGIFTRAQILDLLGMTGPLCDSVASILALLGILDSCIQRAYRTDLLDGRTGLQIDDITVSCAQFLRGPEFL